MKGVFLDLASVDNADLNLGQLEEVLDEWEFYPHTETSQLAGRLQGAEVVVSNKVLLTREVLATADKLRLICVAATGTNNVDLVAARELGIAITNVRAYGTASVVQHVFALLLSLQRRIPAYQQAIRQGRWQQSDFFCLLDFPIEELTDKVLGIVGYGELGQAVAKTAACFDMQVRIAQRNADDVRPERVPLEALLAEADVISLHCPLTDENRGMIGEAQLRLMKLDAILINAARGGLVNEAALATALKNGWIAGAGVDVLEREPPDGSSPLLGDIPNLILTPHIAWASRTARQRLLNQLVDIIRDYRTGTIRNRIA
ncbi:MAG: D-2-hydroxyacid dehydrogenase [Gammaproteobacteria bacterium]|nr:D-2-hydroxyacid dehydrogenase [Gammaproteobacteria bacterium]